MKKKISIFLIALVLVIASIPFSSQASGNALILGVSTSGNTVTVTVGGPENYRVQYVLSGYEGMLEYVATSSKPTPAGVWNGEKATFQFNVIKSGTVKILASVVEAADITTGEAVACQGASATVTVKTQADINAEQAAEASRQQAAAEEASRQQAAAEESSRQQAAAEEASRQQASIAQSIAQAQQESIRQSEAESIAKVEAEQKAKDESIRQSVEAEESRQQAIQDSIAAEQSSSEDTSENSSEDTTEDTTEDTSENVVTTSNTVNLIDGSKLTLSSSLEGVTIPEGFTETTVDVNGNTIQAVQSDKGILLVYLTDEDGTNGNFYVYSKTTNTAIPYTLVEGVADSYTFLIYDGQEDTVNGLTETTITINGKAVPAWYSGEENGMYVVYAMNSKGAAGFYRYDLEEGTFLRYVADSAVVDEDVVEGYQYDLSVAESKYTELNSKYNNDMISRLIFIIGLIILAIILLFVIIVLAVKLKYRDDDDNNDDDDDDNEYFDSESEEELEDRAEQQSDEDLEDEMKEINMESSNNKNNVSEEDLDLEFLTKQLSNVGTENDNISISEEFDDLEEINVDSNDNDDDDFEIVDFNK